MSEIELFRQLKQEISRALQRELSLNTMARESGVSRVTLHNWMDGKVKEPHLSSMIKVANRLGKHLSLVDGQMRFMPAKRPRLAVWLRQ